MNTIPIIFSIIFGLAYSDSSCDNLWSAINTMQLGIDLTTFDIFGHSPGWSIMPVLQYTCNQNRTWINSINKIQYGLPDQLAEQPISIPDDVTYTSSHQTATTKGVETWMSASISESYYFGMFSKTTSISQAYGAIEASQRLWGTQNSSVSSFKVNFIPYQINPQLIRLSDDAQNYINQTIKQHGPIFNGSTVELYETFFKYFGTHVFTTSDTGGVFHLRYETDKSLLAEMSSKSISEQASFSFWNFLDMSGAVSGGEKQVDARFTAMSTIITMCKGGTFCPTSQSDDYDQWQISVASEPWIMNAEFIPVYKLIYDDVLIANSFSEAILNHQQMAYLTNEIQPNIDAVKNAVNAGLQNSCTTVAGNTSCQHLINCTTTVCNQNNNYYSCNGKNQAICQGMQMRQMFVVYTVPDTADAITMTNKVTTVQNVLTQQIIVLQNNVELLLKSNIVQNETLFNETSFLWENLLKYTQSEYTTISATYEPGSVNCVWSSSSATCSEMDCVIQNDCGSVVWQNLTFFTNWQNYPVYVKQ